MNYYPYKNSYTNYRNYNQYNNNRFGGFLFPFALGFVASPLIFGATRPRPVYGPYQYPQYFPYY